MNQDARKIAASRARMGRDRVTAKDASRRSRGDVHCGAPAKFVFGAQCAVAHRAQSRRTRAANEVAVPRVPGSACAETIFKRHTEWRPSTGPCRRVDGSGLDQVCFTSTTFSLNDQFAKAKTKNRCLSIMRYINGHPPSRFTFN